MKCVLGFKPQSPGRLGVSVDRRGRAEQTVLLGWPLVGVLGIGWSFHPSPNAPPASHALSVLSDGTVTPVRKRGSGWQPGLLSGWLSCSSGALGSALCQRPLGWLILHIHPGSMAFSKGHLGGGVFG